MKKCTKCNLEKEFSEYHKDKYNDDGYTYSCKKCRNNNYNNYYKKNPEKVLLKNLAQTFNRKKFYNSPEGIVSSRKAHLKRKYGITLEKYNKMLTAQDNKCAICNGLETHYRNEVLSVDHCHITGEIRELLCSKCNTAIGLLKEDVEIINNALLYLKKHKK